MKYVLIIVLAIVWGFLVYFQAKLITRKRVRKHTELPFGMGICLSLMWLYFSRPKLGFWDLDDKKFEEWLDEMEIELSETEALKLTKEISEKIRGVKKGKVLESIENAERGLKDVYDVAKETFLTIRHQVKLGHDVMYSFGVGAVYCLIPTGIIGFLLVSAYNALFK
jgi:hypothetical protein